MLLVTQTSEGVHRELELAACRERGACTASSSRRVVKGEGGGGEFVRRIGRLLDALDQVGPVEAVRRQAGLGVACVEIEFRTPHAIDATLSP